jgi:two-component system, NtrC family, nitrogen regulation response regulator NtrX
MTTRARGSVLLADDEAGILKTLGRALREDGHEVITTASALEAERMLQERPVDVFVVDHRMPGKTGLELVRQLASSVAEAERPQVIMMTAHATVESAIEAMKLGAFDYLQKPFEVDELLVAVRRALEHQSLRRQHSYLLSEREEEFDHYGIIGKSRAIQDVIHKLELVARSKSTVLITGETGTGKELAARAIHARSAQREMPLIKVNCAAIPESLIESELFGHVKGAFTGATANRRGRFALADGGTLFLDEIGTLGSAVQARLLRVLQEREFEPVGSERTVSVDVRVIAATNRDLRGMVSGGRFLEDLYYRLSVIPIALPPLRERPDDIPLLVRHYVEFFSRENNVRSKRITQAALDALQRYRWKGNIRELRNTVERLIIMTGGETIDLPDLPESVRSPAAVGLAAPKPGAEGDQAKAGTLREFKENAERAFLVGKLRENGWNISKTAEVIGTPRSNLYKKLEQYQIAQETDG